MKSDTTDAQRRSILQTAAGLVAAGGTLLHSASAATPRAPAPTGRPGDFDFLTGEWTIRNRRWKDGAWDAFDGEATVHRILAGVGSVEELRIPARGFSGMGLRLLDVQRRLWADHWVNASSGVLAPPPAWGSFENGSGTWDSEETAGGKTIVYRGVWDQITPTSCRWYQASSEDAGATWTQSWVMQWARR